MEQPNNYKNRKQNLSNIGGKIPPQAIDLEEIVLGAILIEKEALTDIAEFLRPDVFYVEANRLIYGVIQDLNVLSSPIDIVTVTDALRKRGQLEMCGGAFYITMLTDKVASSANIETHARILQEKYIKRELIRSSSVLLNDCYSDENDVFDLLSRSEYEKDELLQSITVRKEVSNSELYNSTLNNLVALKDSKKGLTGTPSGFTDLDRITGGWQKTDLIIIAARPGMGKTSFVLQNALNASFDFNIPGAFFSLEMSMEQLMKKELAIMCGIPLEKFRKNTLNEQDWSAMGQMTEKILNAPIHWDDTPSISLIELCAKARRLKKKHNIQYIAIDYLQLMTGKGGKNTNREQEIGQISRGLKGLAKELGIPVLALSQLSRAVESRAGVNGKRPMLSDLRESGSIEQDADMVIFLYRPEYYCITEDEAGESTDGIAEVIIAKHRNGETDDVPLKFNKVTTGFSDIIIEYFDRNPIEAPINFNEPKQSSIQPNYEFEKEENDAPF